MQQWHVDLTKKCSELNMEAVATMTGLTIICPKLPGKKDKAQLMAMIPEDLRSKIIFEEGPKQSTLNHFKHLILAIGVVGGLNAELDQKKRHIKVLISGNGNPDAEGTDWSGLSDLFEKDGFFDSWDVVFNNQSVLTYNRKIVKELEKNSFRDNVIMKDEITDLHILLETEKDFDKLLEKL